MHVEISGARGKAVEKPAKCVKLNSTEEKRGRTSELARHLEGCRLPSKLSLSDRALGSDTATVLIQTQCQPTSYPAATAVFTSRTPCPPTGRPTATSTPSVLLALVGHDPSAAPASHGGAGDAARQVVHHVIDDDAPSVRPAFEPPSSSSFRSATSGAAPADAGARHHSTGLRVQGRDQMGRHRRPRRRRQARRVVTRSRRRVDESCYPVWKADVSLLCASDELEYKIVILRGDGKGPEWEPLQNNRKLARAKARSVRVRAAWGVPGADEQPQAESRASTSSSSSFPLVGTTPTQEQAFAAPAPAATEVGEGRPPGMRLHRCRLRSGSAP